MGHAIAKKQRTLKDAVVTKKNIHFEIDAT